jgi:hypothetical protein
LVAWTFHIAFCHFSRYHFSKCHGFFGFQKRILVLGCVGASPCFLSIVGTILANAMVYGSSRSASSLDAWRFAPLSAIFVGSMVFGSSGASFWTRQHLALLSAILAELLRWVFLPAQWASHWSILFLYTHAWVSVSNTLSTASGRYSPRTSMSHLLRWCFTLSLLLWWAATFYSLPMFSGLMCGSKTLLPWLSEWKRCLSRSSSRDLGSPTWIFWRCSMLLQGLAP